MNKAPGRPVIQDYCMSISEVDIFGRAVVEARAMVDRQLESYVAFDAGCPDQLSDAIRYSLMSPGKRLRPLLALAACHVCGGDVEAALPAACAVEMIHTYSLIHDDLPAMDDDDMRRGQPSCHVAFDEATAILAGDALIPLAFEVIARDVHPSDVAANCVHELAVAAGACNLVGGQSDDLGLQHASIDLTTLESVHRRKTGALITTSLKLGCFCAQATRSQLESLTEYGKHLGLAFQITDDLLDLCGDEARIGKRTGKDSQRGKTTYPELIGVQASQELAERMSSQAIAALSEFGESAEELRRFARFVVNRKF
jgi:geranylgeranyl diphosphate synthase type II